jgi:8-hydroxy-5-deazaflavin:NADPH oxidoreductase
MCGDQPSALDRVAALIRDLGGRAAVVGGFASARQFEEATGFVMRVAASRHNPMFAISHVDRPPSSGPRDDRMGRPVTALA